MRSRSTEAFAAVLFDVAGIGCAMALADVREVLPLPHLTRPPGAPAGLEGIADVSGVAVPVLRPAALFGLPVSEVEPDLDSHLLVLRGTPIALLVDRARDVITVSRSGVSDVPDAETLRGCVTGVFTAGGRRISLVAAGRLIHRHERDRLEAYAAREALRAAQLTVEP
ncbi:chemotaxis protein CheW [Chthonobacter albigriseus]|uniref:chemotaxis protein CheW n=1 Tax=Chthonobacter albigriseus TaxID=1683161 RepID=UPI0015EF7E60